MPVTSTPSDLQIDLSVKVNPPAEAATVSTKLAAIILPCGPVAGVPPDLAPIGVSLVTSDATVTNTRTLHLSLSPPITIPTATNPQTNEFRGSIVSSDPTDALLGRVVYFNGATPSPVAKSDGLPINGTTVVPLIQVDKANITGIEFDEGAVPTGMIVLSNDAGQPVFVIPADWTGSIFSSSDFDNATGIGLQGVRVNYLDSASASHHEDIMLAGKTKLPLVNTNKRSVVSLEFLAFGSFGQPCGTVVLKSAVDGGGTIMATIGQSFNQSYPIGTDQMAPFRDIYKHVVAASMGVTVTQLNTIT